MGKFSIAFLSGKGGTGKTFISTNFANAIDSSSYVDTDVEEPNGSVFFKSDKTETESVLVKIPKFNYDKCTGCRVCADFCKFNAIIFIKKPFLVTEICHSCGGCYQVCDFNAITLIDKEIGTVDKSVCNGHKIVSGKMNVGEMSGTPIIKQAKESINDGIVAIDCPPGSSCLLLEAIHDVNYCVLVVESTNFGFHNFKMVYEVCKQLNVQIGIVVNKYDGENKLIFDFAKSENINILDVFPFDKEINRITSSGGLITDIPEYKSRFENIFKKIQLQSKEEK